MGLFDKLKSWNAERKHLSSLKILVQNGETLDMQDTQFFTEKTGKTPQAYKLEYDDLRARFEEAKRKRALDLAEKRYDIGGLEFRQDKDGLYYFSSSFEEFSPRYVLTDFQWNGPVYKQVQTVQANTRTTGYDREQTPSVGLFDNRPRKNSKIDLQSVTITEQQTNQIELDTDCILSFVNIKSQECVYKPVRCNSKIIREITGLKFINL